MKMLPYFLHLHQQQQLQECVLRGQRKLRGREARSRGDAALPQNPRFDPGGMLRGEARFPRHLAYLRVQMREMRARAKKKGDILVPDSLRVPAQMDINCRGYWRTCWISRYMNMQDLGGQESRPIASFARYRPT